MYLPPDLLDSSFFHAWLYRENFDLEVRQFSGYRKCPTPAFIQHDDSPAQEHAGQVIDIRTSYGTKALS
ncbi:hypothetical protein DBV33_14545 [Pseudomonas fluorescens]|nr:hypothetical protein DBV33_14545 [Pseudomonas fluorescens]